MSDKNAIKDVIDVFLKNYKHRDRLSEYDIRSSWSKIVGSVVANHTLKIYIRNQILYIHVDSAALRNELDYSRNKVIELVNKHAKRQLINDIALY